MKRSKYPRIREKNLFGPAPLSLPSTRPGSRPAPPGGRASLLFPLGVLASPPSKIFFSRSPPKKKNLVAFPKIFRSRPVLGSPKKWSSFSQNFGSSRGPQKKKLLNCSPLVPPYVGSSFISFGPSARNHPPQIKACSAQRSPFFQSSSASGLPSHRLPPSGCSKSVAGLRFSRVLLISLKKKIPGPGAARLFSFIRPGVQTWSSSILFVRLGRGVVGRPDSFITIKFQKKD